MPRFHQRRGSIVQLAKSLCCLLVRWLGDHTGVQCSSATTNRHPSKAEKKSWSSGAARCNQVCDVLLLTRLVRDEAANPHLQRVQRIQQRRTRPRKIGSCSLLCPSQRVRAALVAALRSHRRPLPPLRPPRHRHRCCRRSGRTLSVFIAHGCSLRAVR